MIVSSNDFRKGVIQAEGDRYMTNISVFLVLGDGCDQRIPEHSKTLSAVNELRFNGVVKRFGLAKMATPPWEEQVR